MVHGFSQLWLNEAVDTAGIRSRPWRGWRQSCSTASVDAMSIDQIPLTTLDGKNTTLGELSTRATLVVNVASNAV